MEIQPSLVPTLLMVVPFLVTMVGLYVILFGPLVAWLQEREHVVEKARHDADDFRDQIVTQTQELEKQLASARADAQEVRAAARARAGVKEAEILGAARTVADGEVSAAVAEIAREKKEVAGQIGAMANQLSAELAQQVLGRSIQA